MFPTYFFLKILEKKELKPLEKPVLDIQKNRLLMLIKEIINGYIFL